MTDAIEDSLLDGETVIWRGAPDYALAKDKPMPRWQARLTHLAWAAGLIFATAGLVAAGHFWLPYGFLGLVLAFAAVAVGIVALIVTGTFLFRPADREWGSYTGEVEVLYALTNQRLIMQFGRFSRTSILRTGIASLCLLPNGSAHDLIVHGSGGEGDEIMLRAIADGPAVERLILQTLPHPKPGDPS